MAITLRKLIDQVRDELLSAPQEPTPEALYPFLFVEEVELELNVAITAGGKGGGKVSIQIVELGGETAYSREQTHRIKVKMTPLLTKDEVRAQLQQDKGVWDRIQHLALVAATKEIPLAG